MIESTKSFMIGLVIGAIVGVAGTFAGLVIMALLAP